MKSSGYWYIRLLTGLDIRPLFVGLVTCATLLLIFITWVAIADWQNRDFDFSVERMLIELTLIVPAPALTLDEKSLADEAASITEQSSAIHLWILCWILTVIVFTWWISGMAIVDSTLVLDSSQPSIAGWPYFRNFIYVFTLSQLAWIDIALARRLGKLLEEHGKINLLDRSSLQQLEKRARRSVLVWIPLLVNSFVYFVVVLPVVIFPAAGIRRRYVEEKNQQLEKVRARIADRSAAVVDGSSTSESSNLPELVSWEARLQQTRVWPYDMTIYLCVFLYAGIGLSFWIGAALVERFIVKYSRVLHSPAEVAAGSGHSNLAC